LGKKLDSLSKDGRDVPFNNLDYKKLIQLYDYTKFGKYSNYFITLIFDNSSIDLNPFDEKEEDRGMIVNLETIQDIFRQIEP